MTCDLGQQWSRGILKCLSKTVCSEILVLCVVLRHPIYYFFTSKTRSILEKKYPEEKRTILELRKRSGNSLRELPLHTKKEKVQTINDFQTWGLQLPTVVLAEWKRNKNSGHSQDVLRYSFLSMFSNLLSLSLVDIHHICSCLLFFEFSLFLIFLPIF